jgi:glycine/D-amino acid oxidase-like deaminating enzyme
LQAEIVICGAGIAGVSAAYHLAVEHGVRDIVLVDERPPLSLTSDKSAECYRNWWPHPAMVGLMNRSIDLLWEIERNSGYAFQVNQRGYLFVSGRTESKLEFELVGRKISALGAGPLRVHRNQPDDPDYPPPPKNGFDEQLTGADLFLDASQIQSTFPFLTPEAEAALHIRRAGWFSAQQYGMYLLEQARHHGVRLQRTQVIGVRVENGSVQGVRLLGENAPEEIVCKTFIIAAGPFLKSAGAMLNVDLPVYCELHAERCSRSATAKHPTSDLGRSSKADLDRRRTSTVDRGRGIPSAMRTTLRGAYPPGGRRR